MAGYSGSPLPKKLGIKEGQRVVLIDPPEGFDETLGELPRGATVHRMGSAKKSLQVVIWFVARSAELERRFSALRKQMASETSLWIAWPKKSSGVISDMTENKIRDVALPTGLVDNKVCAIDETWAGLRLVVRLVHRR